MSIEVKRTPIFSDPDLLDTPQTETDFLGISHKGRLAQGTRIRYSADGNSNGN